MCNSVDEVIKGLDEYNVVGVYSTPEDNSKYFNKYMVKIPETISIPREDFILAKCENKVILDIGCVGPLHVNIMKVAKETWGIDIQDNPGYPNYFKCDLSNQPIPFPLAEKFDLVVCGEVIEHLINPGQFLMQLHAAKCPIIVTVPNAFGSAGMKCIRNTGYENVNKDHVAYYSYGTFKVLATKCKYKISEYYWYNGEPRLSEGIIFVLHSEVSNGLSKEKRD